MEIRLTESALADLEDIHSWYGEQGAPGVGTRFVADIIARIERLEDYPDIGRIVPEFGQDDLREIIYPPFRIVYRRDPLSVRIVRVWRSERRLRLAEDEDAAPQP